MRNKMIKNMLMLRQQSLKPNQKKRNFLNTFSFLKGADLFGREVNLLYDEKLTFKTYCGVWATFSLMFCLACFAFFELRKVLSGEVRSFSYYVSHYTHTPSYSNNEVVEQFFLRRMKYAYYFEDPELNDQSLLYVSHVNKNFHVSKIHCEDLGISKHFELQKKVSCATFNVKRLLKKDLRIRISKCIDRPYCKPLDEINSILNKKVKEGIAIKFVVLIEVNDNDIGEMENEVKTKMKKIVYEVNPKLYTKNLIGMMQYEQITTDSYVFKHRDFRSLVVEKTEERVADINPKIKLKDIMISLNKDKKVFVKKRLYRLMDFLSLFGGMMKGATVLIFIIYWPIRELLYARKLINEMFIVCSDQEDFKKLVKNSVEKADDKIARRPNRRVYKVDKSKASSGVLVDKKLLEQKMKKTKDNIEIKKLVDKVRSIKQNFHRKGLFHNFLSEIKEMNESGAGGNPSKDKLNDRPSSPFMEAGTDVKSSLRGRGTLHNIRSMNKVGADGRKRSTMRGVFNLFNMNKSRSSKVIEINSNLNADSDRRTSKS